MKTPKHPRSTLRHDFTARRLLSAMSVISIFVTVMISPAYAATLQSSNFYTGFVALLNDLMTAAMFVCPIIGGLAAVVCLARRSMADEQEGKMWTKRATTAIFCGVGGCLVTGVIALITSYVNP